MRPSIHLSDDQFATLKAAVTPIPYRVLTEIEMMEGHLRALGFTPGDAIGPKGEVSDRPVANLVYLARVFSDQYQRVSLVCAHDDGRFLEAVVQVYAKPFNARTRPRQDSLHSMIYRDWDSLLAAVSVMYPLPKP